MFNLLIVCLTSNVLLSEMIFMQTLPVHVFILIFLSLSIGIAALKMSISVLVLVCLVSPVVGYYKKPHIVMIVADDLVSIV